eukprot:324580-Rhodomonas_salina.1
MCCVLLQRPLQELVMEQERLAWQALGQRVSHVERASSLDQSQHRVAYQVADEIAQHINVVCELPVHQVILDLNARRIVLPDNRRLRLL